jgi:CopG family nickel-responsive transcriptional regulator
MESELTRIGVSMPENILTKFDTIIKQRGYSSRSEGIRDTLRTYINYHEWMNVIHGRRFATISLIYDHNKYGLTEALAEIKIDYYSIIKSSIHIHIEDNLFLEVLILDGEGEDIKMVAERAIALKGVNYVKLNTATPSENMS